MNARWAVLFAALGAAAPAQEVQGPPDVRAVENQCKKGAAAACTNAGVIYHEGMGVPRDLVKGTAFFQRACNGGDPRGCSNLGITHVKESITGAEAEVAVRLLERGCTGNDALGCRTLGWMYDRGHGVPVDSARSVQLYAKALALYQKDCAGGDGRACTMIGVSASEGKGSARDEKRAVEYEQGTGITRDRIQALAVRNKACAIGYTPACARARPASSNERSFP